MKNMHRKKYHNFYQGIAALAADESVAERRKVGAAIVSTSGMIATGWNGMPPGFANECEHEEVDFSGNSRLKTKPEVIHAERNAIDKMTKEGVSTKGAILFTTTAPCMECAKSIAAVGIREVFYRDLYKNNRGLAFLKAAGVKVSEYIL